MSQNGNIKGMDKIPTDIARTAKKVSDQLPMIPDDDELEAAIAAAIMAERERCARIVEAFRETTTEGRAELAAAIRGGVE